MPNYQMFVIFSLSLPAPVFVPYMDDSIYMRYISLTAKSVLIGKLHATCCTCFSFKPFFSLVAQCSKFEKECGVSFDTLLCVGTFTLLYATEN